jgi:prolyl-tRNA synthetase
MSDLSEIFLVLNSIQEELMNSSREFLARSIRDVTDLNDLKNFAQRGGVFRGNWCGSGKCEKSIKAETDGAEIRGTLYGKGEKVFDNCIYCGEPAKHVVYIAKAY